MTEGEIVTTAIDWSLIWWSVALLALAVAILLLEFFLVSFGMLAVAAIVCACAAIYLAFSAHEVAGWIFLITVPLLATITVRWGVRRVRHSRLVPKDEITAEAGYHHVADRLGVSAGSVGVMVTAARPSGRARFDGGECDVQVQGRPLEAEDRISVMRIDGPIIFVKPLDDGDPGGGAPPTTNS